MLSIGKLFEQEEVSDEEALAAEEVPPNEQETDSLGKQLLNKALVRQEVEKRQAEEMQSAEEEAAAADQVEKEKSSARVAAMAADMKAGDTDLQALKASAQLANQKEGDKVKALASGKNPDEVDAETAEEEAAAEQLTSAVQQETKEVVDIADDIFKKVRDS